VIRLGLIGAGRWGRNYIRTIAALDGVRLTRLASRNPASRELVGPECKISADWRHVVESGDLEGIIIATPPSLHAEMTIAAVAAGIPVLVEKPLTLGLAEAVTLREQVRTRKGRVMVDHTHLFHPAFEELKRQVAALGMIREIEAEAGNQGPYREDVPVLWDWGPHDVAMCLDLLGEPPREARGMREELGNRGTAVTETIQLELEFSSGARARIRISNMMEKTRRFSVRCEAGVLVYDDIARNKLMLHRDGRDGPINVSAEPPLSRVVEAFVAGISAGNDTTGSLDLAVNVVAVLERCARTLATA
jgi:predicted dehydrogenase